MGGAEGEKHTLVPKKQEIYFSENRGDVYEFSHQAIDNGADIVIGHGPHVLRGMEIYKNRLIAYSLGNFMGYRLFSTEGKKGISVILKLLTDSKGVIIKGNIIPIHLKDRGIPKIDKEKRGIELVRSLNKKNFPENYLKINDNGDFVLEK